MVDTDNTLNVEATIKKVCCAQISKKLFLTKCQNVVYMNGRPAGPAVEHVLVIETLFMWAALVEQNPEPCDIEFSSIASADLINQEISTMLYKEGTNFAFV